VPHRDSELQPTRLPLQGLWIERAFLFVQQKRVAAKIPAIVMVIRLDTSILTTDCPLILVTVVESGFS